MEARSATRIFHYQILVSRTHATLNSVPHSRITADTVSRHYTSLIREHSRRGKNRITTLSYFRLRDWGGLGITNSLLAVLVTAVVASVSTRQLQRYIYVLQNITSLQRSLAKKIVPSPPSWLYPKQKSKLNGVVNPSTHHHPLPFSPSSLKLLIHAEVNI